MIAPRKVKFEAKKKENENIEFRTFLKCNADEEELDKQFKELHEELFANYDCNRCRNCCKMYHGSIPNEDLERDAQFLNMTKEQFVDTFLVKNEIEHTYETERLQSLYSVLNAVEVCPVAFEIYERLKKEYHFKNR